MSIKMFNFLEDEREVVVADAWALVAERDAALAALVGAELPALCADAYDALIDAIVTGEPHGWDRTATRLRELAAAAGSALDAGTLLDFSRAFVDAAVAKIVTSPDLPPGSELDVDRAGGRIAGYLVEHYRSRR